MKGAVASAVNRTQHDDRRFDRNGFPPGIISSVGVVAVGYYLSVEAESLSTLNLEFSMNLIKIVWLFVFPKRQKLNPCHSTQLTK
jgi:hypothetical protein